MKNKSNKKQKAKNKKFLKSYWTIAGWVTLYVAFIGFILPYLISYPSDLMVILGYGLSLVLLARLITFPFWKKLFNKLK
jgi:hypothetical protein